jgi:hypothetical protein
MENTFSDSIKHINLDFDIIENSVFNNSDDKIHTLSPQLALVEQIIKRSEIDPIISQDENNCTELRWFVGTNIHYLEIKAEDLFWTFENKDGYGFYKRLGSIEDVFVEMEEIGVLKV